MSIPSEITRGHILRAILELKKLGKKAIPPRHRSKKYDLLEQGEKYPPKYLISFAHTFVHRDRKEWSNKLFKGGPETNNFLKSRGFKIFDRAGKEVGFEAVPEDDEKAFPEGRIVYGRHRWHERNPKLAGAAKNRRLRKSKDLACDVCGFSFRAAYGAIGIGFIEAHHTLPLSQLSGRRKTRLDEIALVCSNCHRMLHRRRPWLSIEKLKELKSEGRKQSKPVPN